MKKKIQKHIDKQQYVKVYLEESDGSAMTSFEGVIFEQNEKFILMCDTHDFDYDGLIILRKKDISKIRRSEFDKFVDMVLEKEDLKPQFIHNYTELDFHLGTWSKMFGALQIMEKAVIVDMLYGEDELFQLGSVSKVKPNSVVIDYISASGKYDLKPVVAKFKEITCVRIDSKYADLYYKYAKRVK